ncbi:hypothetical protein BJ741DRAFT_587051 [Chytriomyces cf. hyalinus JEL632]|nr:hypothetical protein BJ741DRAFT_587051 [Chytriomyces cf. hyalinus JEL632]
MTMRLQIQIRVFSVCCCCCCCCCCVCYQYLPMSVCLSVCLLKERMSPQRKNDTKYSRRCSFHQWKPGFNPQQVRIMYARPVVR